MNGICYVEQEESYTSMASFWDLDEMPVYGEAGLVAIGPFPAADLPWPVSGTALEGGSTLMSMVL